MKHILPILGLILSAATIVVSGLCLILFILIGFYSAPIATSAFAVPALFLAVVMSALSIASNFMFLRHKLSLVGFILGIVSAAVCIVSFVIMFSF